jgi:undecaprenyl diphosphate synthase
MGLKGKPKAKVREDALQIPRHVAIIMDGNGRWAMQRGLPRLAGHRSGVDNIRPIIECLSDYGVEYVTVYAFSTENWNRPTEEVEGLMTILHDAIHKETQVLHEMGVRILHLGRTDRLSPELQQSITYAQELTKDNSVITLSVAFDYGGRSEILEAVKRVIREGAPLEQLDEAAFSRYLYTAHMPDPDLIIRTGGELRLSNFLLWQSAYSEYYTTPTLWPDLGEADVDRAMDAFSHRQRRFGTLQPEDASV